MWRRVFTFAKPWTYFKAQFKSSNILHQHVKISLRLSSTIVVPSLMTLDLPNQVPKSPSNINIKKVSNNPDDILIIHKKEQEVLWQPSFRDLVQVAKILCIGVALWGISGVILGGVLFRACSNVGHHVSRMISIPACILSGGILASVGLYRGLGHALIYFINKGVAVHILNKVVPTRLGDATVIHWDAAVSRVTYSFRLRADQSGFFAGMLLRSLAQRLESFLLLVKDEDKIKHGNLTEVAINHKLTKLITHQMRKPLYVVGVVYGAVITGVAIFVWKA